MLYKKNMFNLLKKFKDKFAKKEAFLSLGVDFGSFAIKVAEVNFYKDTIELTSYGQARTFENSIIKHEIVDINLVITVLKNLCHNLQVKATFVSYGLPAILSFFEKIHLKTFPNEENIQQRLSEEIPFNFEDVIYSYFIVPSQDGFDLYYLYAKKNIVDKISKIVNSLNLHLRSVDSVFINLHNFLEYMYGKHSKLIIDWGYSDIRLIFTDKEVPINIRNISNLGYKKLEQDLVNNLKVDKEQALKIMFNPFLYDLDKVKKLFIEYIKKVIEEVDLSINRIKDKYAVGPEVFYIVGGGGRLPNCAEIFANNIGLDYQKIEIQKKIKINKNIDINYLDIINTQGFLAVANAVMVFI